MAKPKIVLNKQEVKKLLKGDGPYKGIQDDIDVRLDRIKAAAGAGVESETRRSPNRARGEVWTESPEAMRSEATDANLTRALDAGRGDTGVTGEPRG